MLTLVQRQPRMAQVSWHKMSAWHSRARQRDSLAQLDDHLLADIGLTREAQLVECSKPFWCP